jgi:hypothetical protein
VGITTQTEIALSTMKAKYIALSTTMHALFPVKNLHKVLCESFATSVYNLSTVSIVWEYNQVATILATHDPPKMTLQSKHITIEKHLF